MQQKCSHACALCHVHRKKESSAAAKLSRCKDILERCRDQCGGVKGENAYRGRGGCNQARVGTVKRFGHHDQQRQQCGDVKVHKLHAKPVNARQPRTQLQIQARGVGPCRARHTCVAHVTVLQRNGVRRGSVDQNKVNHPQLQAVAPKLLQVKPGFVARGARKLVCLCSDAAAHMVLLQRVHAQVRQGLYTVSCYCERVWRRRVRDLVRSCRAVLFCLRGLHWGFAVFCYCKRVWRRRGRRNVNGCEGRDRVLAGGIVTQRKTLHTCAFARSGIVPWPRFLVKYARRQVSARRYLHRTLRLNTSTYVPACMCK